LLFVKRYESQIVPLSCVFERETKAEMSRLAKIIITVKSMDILLKRTYVLVYNSIKSKKKEFKYVQHHYTKAA